MRRTLFLYVRQFQQISWPLHWRTWRYRQSEPRSKNYNVPRLKAFRSNTRLSFLFESAATTETIGRYSFVGAGLSRIHGDKTLVSCWSLKIPGMSSRLVPVTALKSIHFLFLRRNLRDIARLWYPVFPFLHWREALLVMLGTIAYGILNLVLPAQWKMSSEFRSLFSCSLIP